MAASANQAKKNAAGRNVTIRRRPRRATCAAAGVALTDRAGGRVRDAERRRGREEHDDPCGERAIDDELVDDRDRQPEDEGRDRFAW